MKNIVIMLSLCVWSFSAQPARILSAVSEASPEAPDKSQLMLVGQAQFSVLFWDIYQSRLYSPSGQFNRGEKPLLFEIHYQKDISGQELLTATIEQWQHLEIDERDYQEYIPRLKALWPNISAGDSLTLFSDDNSSYFYFNGDYLGKITDAKFSGLFLDIWLSPKTSQPKLRQDLLGIKP